MIITIANRRGGAGKTATAHALAAGLRKNRYNVLLIDLDSQGNLTFDTGAPFPIRSGALDVLTGEAAALDAIIKTEAGDLLPATGALAAADTMIKSEYTLKKILDGLKDDGGTPLYDVVLIDTPPALGSLTVNALTASDGVIIAAQPEIHSFHGALLLRDTVQTVRKYSNPALSIYAFMITQYKRTILSRDMLANFEHLAKEEKARCFTVRDCNAVKEAQAVKSDIFSYAPKSKAAADYAALVDYAIELYGKELVKILHGEKRP